MGKGADMKTSAGSRRQSRDRLSVAPRGRKGRSIYNSKMPRASKQAGRRPVGGMMVQPATQQMPATCEGRDADDSAATAARARAAGPQDVPEATRDVREGEGKHATPRPPDSRGVRVAGSRWSEEQRAATTHVDCRLSSSVEAFRRWLAYTDSQYGACLLRRPTRRS